MNDENKNSVRFDSETSAEFSAQLNLLYEIGRILASAETMKEAVPQILEAICRNLRFEIGELWCLGKGETVMHLESVWHSPSPQLEKFVAESHHLEFPVGDGLPGKVWEKNAPVWLENLSVADKMPRRYFADETGLQSGFAFPILLGEKFIGAFSFFTHAPRQPDKPLLEMFAAVGNHIGQFVKRERTESTLRESEDRYRAFIEQSTEGIWRFELDEKFSINLPVDEQVGLAFKHGYLAECNDAMARMYGLTKAEELVGSRIADLLDVSDAANVEYIRTFIESGYNLVDGESHEKDASGDDKYFLNGLVGTIENGFLVRVWGTQRDITEEKKVEKAMRESEENFRAFVQASSQAIWMTGANGQNLEAFGWWENQTGQTREQSAGAGFLNAIHPEDRERIGNNWRKAMGSVTAFETECRIADRNGDYRHFAIRGVPVFNTDNSFRQWIGTLTDINDRKSAEQSLKRNEERYRALVEATSTVVWRANENGELNFIGSFLETMDGERRDKVLGSGWLDALHPDDREKTYRIWQTALAAKNIYETEFRVWLNGEYRWFAVRGVPILNPDGSVREWVGANTDVHQRKLAEQSVSESEESYRIVAETASDAIIKIDEDSRISFVNSAVERIFGHAAETMVGESLTMIMPESMREQHLAGFRRYLETGERHLPWEGLEIPALHAQGHTFPLEISFGEYNQHGKRFFIGIARDITDRKSAEEAVRESEANFRQLAEAVPQFVWVTETNGLLSYVNRQWTEFSGLTLEQTADPKLLAAVFHPDDAPRLAKEWEKSFLSGEVLAVDVRLRNRHGEYRWFLTRSRPVKDADGKITKWFGTSTDITDGKWEETRLALLAEISELTRTTEDVNDLLFAVSQTVGEHLEVRRCLFNEIDLEADREIVHRDYCHSGVESVAGVHRISDYSSITSADMRAGKTVVNTDSKTDLRTANEYAKTYEPNGERAYVAVPMLRSNRWTASLWVSDDKPREWSAQEISLLETVAERTWTAIEKIRINNDLRESEERLQLAVDISRISTFDIDLKTDAVETDETGRAIYGFDLNEPLTFTKVQSHFHPEDRDEVTRQVNAAFAPEGINEFEVEQRIIRTDGEVRWIRVRGRAFFEGEGVQRRAVYCLGTYIDITRSKLSESALLERERLALLNADVSRALIKNSSLPDILRVCTEAVVEHLDAAFARIWTLNKEENILELQASSGIYTHLDGEHSRVPVGKFKIGTIAEERKPHLTNSVIGDIRVGNQEWAIREKMASFAGYPLLVEDRLVGVVAMFARQPLTAKTIEALAVAANAIALGIERKQTESERERLLVSEQQAREVAEEANFAKDEFIALVSHELRSPLNAMLGWTRILQNQNPDEKTKEYALDVIVRNARSQSRLIEDLLDIARVSRGKLRLEMEPTELIPIIEQAIEIVKPTAEANNINLTQSLDRAADFITGDVDRLRQVIDNLLSNAVKFTTSGGKVEIKLRRENNNAKIFVSDNGQGISPEFLPQIFERFKQADPSTTRRHGGLGIGLSLARDLVELHGGTISAESAGEGKGSTFTVTLPLRMILPIKENSDKVEFMDSHGKLSGFWILAVDDEADARELVSFMLQINGAKVTTANSAVEALDILKSANGRLPDVLLSDISMPNESGYALLEKIRALPNEHGGQIPAVALTAFNRPEDREAAFDAGFQKHLGKPVEPEDLISAIIETAGK